MIKVTVLYCEHGLGEEVEFAKRVLELAKEGFTHIAREDDGFLFLATEAIELPHSDAGNVSDAYYDSSEGLEFAQVLLESGTIVLVKCG